MAQIISIFSTKGGVGRTLISTNLAVCFGQRLKDKKVLLLDFDLHLPGHMARLLNLNPERALVELVSEWQKDKYDPAMLDDCIRHYPSGNFDFLPIVLSPRESPLIDEKFITHVLGDLGKEYDFIIVDSGRSFTKRLIYLFEQTNLILFVVNPDVLSVYQAKDAIDILQSLHFPLSMMKAILNRAESQGGVAWREVKIALPCDIIARIPSEGKIVGSALNRRIPVVMDSPRSRVSIALGKLADELLSHPKLFVSHQELKSVFAERSSAEDASLKEEPISLETVSLMGRPHATKRLSRQERIDQLKQRVHKRIIHELDLRRLDRIIGDAARIEDLRQRTMKAINNALTDEVGALISSREERERLVKEMTDEALGLGPLEDLIEDPEISDIMVNNKSQIYVERRGRLELTSKRFVSNDQVRQIIERIIAPLGRRIDESTPMVDARLADGSRVNAIIPPLSLTGPTLTIRKFARERLKINDLVEKFDTLDNVMGEFIRACVLSRKNVIVSGGTGSGKTTVLNVLSEFVPDGERVVTIEDAAELKLHHQHWIRLESRPPNIEGKGAISVRDLFRNSLRMRPDRIIIGECRGPETLDMLQAMNTGHDGSMTTLHANSTFDVLARLDSLILMSGIEIPLRAIREMMASAIDIIVHTARLSDGSRKVLQVTEITGMLDELHIGLKDIFVFAQSGVDEQGNIQGEFRPTGTQPTFLEDIRKRGIHLTEDMFKPK
ncbi:MAG: ATPase, T2SS/T4P/T4SS family [Candidatus Omnitrophota bacterium]|jgi:septum site-determining protein MinD